MALEKLTDNVAIHQTLGDNPNTDGEGMTAEELKKAFDEPATILKNFINNFLIPYVLDKRGDTLAGILDASGNRITGLPEPSADTDAVSRAFVQGAALMLSGGTMQGAVTLNGLYLTPGVDLLDSVPETLPEGRVVLVKVGV